MNAMKIENYTLDELRKKYDNEKNFIIRIREQEKEKRKKDCNDIVYYGGIKAFYVLNNVSKGNDVRVNIPENIYKMNQTNIRNIIKSVSGLESIEDFIECEDNESFLKSKAELIKKFEKYFKYTIKGGNFKFGSVLFDKDKEKIKEYVKERLKLLNKKLEKMGTGFDIDNTLEELDKIKSQKDKIAFKLKNIDKLETKELIKIEELMILYTTFSDLLTTDRYSGMALPEFKYDKSFKEISGDEIKEFNEDIIDAINKYENKTKVELEKKYQHFFMTQEILKNYDNLSFVVPFEEEYYTSENDVNKDRGRIDCIYVLPKKGQSEIFLIELKVNEGVIGKKDELDEHGINTHLVDIDDLISNKNKLDSFLKKLGCRFNYRNEILGKDMLKIDEDGNLENLKLHYWLVVAIDGKDYEEKKKHANEVLKKIRELNDDKYINKLKEKDCINFLNESDEESYLRTYDNKKCDIKLLFTGCNLKDDIVEDNFMSIKEFKELYEEHVKN